MYRSLFVFQKAGVRTSDVRPCYTYFMFALFRPHSKTAGFSLVEIVIGAALVLLIYAGLVKLYNYYISNSLDSTRYVQASFLLEEGVEALKTMRDYGWNTEIAPLAIGTSYRLGWDVGQSRWTATSSASLIDGFDRTFVLGAVYRDGSSNITTAGGALDPSARLVTVSVAWPRRGATTTRTLQTYIFNIRGN